MVAPSCASTLRSDSSSSSATNADPCEGDGQGWSKQLALTLATAADDRKASDIVILKVSDISYLADFFVIVTGFSRTQVRAIAEAMAIAAQEHCGRKPLRREGESEATWIVQDYGEVIGHILMPQQREFYDLEAFWGHAEQLEFPQPIPE